MSDPIVPEGRPFSADGIEIRRTIPSASLYTVAPPPVGDTPGTGTASPTEAVDPIPVELGTQNRGPLGEGGSPVDDKRLDSSLNTAHSNASIPPSNNTEPQINQLVLPSVVF
eukprot:Protomagalhaensia_wolfi_Nauph_80__433@NODE_123_length_3572_cov_63_628644_g3_i1_p5_GENE_NODE_123_length_3572_cov_63_628644_g3_i1NODE_123_length_3572_cov_63_628644_g3_i1_p5_ORF_typecomplete_len112_score19_24_NODE_123_length_3572_cov_63_628644_g3_i1453788